MQCDSLTHRVCDLTREVDVVLSCPPSTWVAVRHDAEEALLASCAAASVRSAISSLARSMHERDG